MKYAEYLDKVHGGWLGKCLGGAAGAAVEGYKELIPYAHYSEVIRTDLPNDDLDLQLLWLEVLQKKGLNISSHDLADAWDKQCWYPFSEYGLFLKNYERGIMPPTSGWFNNPLFKEGEGCPIRSEIWAMIFPGYPEKAAEYAQMDGVLDHADSSVWIEQYYAAMEAEAFYQEDIFALIGNHIHYLPEGSKARNCVELVLSCYEKDSSDWQKARTKLLRKYAHNEFTNSVPNLGLVILALLYGERDLDKTINIAFRSGYDTDCTCATAAALLGIILGASRISDELKRLAGDVFVAGIVLDRTDFTIEGLAKETCLIGLAADSGLGGKITEIPADITIPVRQEPCRAVEISVRYADLPCIHPEKPCKVVLTLKNHGLETVKGSLAFANVPAGWELSADCRELTLAGDEQKEVEVIFALKEIETLMDKNIITVSFAEETRSFGISGAALWQAIGPYLEPLVKDDCFSEKEEKDPEGDCESLKSLTLECMVNNAAYLEKEYIDESDFRTSFHKEEREAIYAAEDILPMDEVFSFCGQGCIYLRQELISPEDREVWAVIGNNDGFVLWVNGQEILRRDEIRLWTPYNNYITLPLKQGENEIVLKLLRRTESLKFGMGFRKFEGDHFHRKRWFVDMGSKYQN